MSYYEYEEVLGAMEFPLPPILSPVTEPTTVQLHCTYFFKTLLAPVRFTCVVTRFISLLVLHILTTFAEVAGTILSSGIAVIFESLSSIGDFVMSLPEFQELGLDFGPEVNRDRFHRALTQR